MSGLHKLAAQPPHFLNGPRPTSPSHAGSTAIDRFRSEMRRSRAFPPTRTIDTGYVPHYQDNVTPQLARFTPQLARFTPQLARFTPQLARFTPQLARFTPQPARFTPQLARFTPQPTRFPPRLATFPPQLAR